MLSTAKKNQFKKNVCITLSIAIIPFLLWVVFEPKPLTLQQTINYVQSQSHGDKWLALCTLNAVPEGTSMIKGVLDDALYQCGVSEIKLQAIRAIKGEMSPTN